MTPNTRRIGILGFDGIQAMDLVGPADAFGSDAFDDAAGSGRPYEVVVIGLTGLRFTSSSGLRLHAHAGADARVQLDTLIVPGGRGLRRPGVAERAAEWIVARAPDIRRIASVCTGLYALGPTGLLDGCAVTTHWSAARDVARLFPKLRVEADAIFLKSGKYYTSAGVSAGIDLALALIEEDHGPAMALSVAREMVVYLKRAGGQDQYSEPLRFQVKAPDRFRDLVPWIHAHLSQDLGVERLAARSYLSVRQFSRAFKAAFGVTPGIFVEEARLAEAGRRLSASGRPLNVEQLARSVGYSSSDVFRRAFERRYGVSPGAYRERFALESGS